MTPRRTALIEAHVGRTRAFARGLGWRIAGGDVDDTEAEALVALCDCALTYRPELGAFWPYAKRAIRNHLIWKLREAAAFKRAGFGTSSVGWDDGEEIELVAVLEDRRADVHRAACAREQLRAIFGTPLSELERRALFGQAFGYSYDELTDREAPIVQLRDDRAPQARWRDVDNATQRARAKLRRAA